MHSRMFSWRWAPPVLVSLSLLLAALPVLGEEADGTEKKKLPLHVSTGSGVFIPWDGDLGFNVSASVHKGLGSDRFWVGGELEYRRYAAELKPDFEPDFNTFALRFSFQYHPYPDEVISPYAGVGVGIALSKVDNPHSRSDRRDRVRQDFSGGPTLVGVGGVDLAIPAFDPVSLFAEARIGNTTDLWVRKGGRFQTDQIDGFTGMAGLRFTY